MAESNCTPGCAHSESGLTGYAAQGAVAGRAELGGAGTGAGAWAGTGLEAVGKVATEGLPVACVRAGGNGFSRKGSWILVAPHRGRLPKLTVYSSLSLTTLACGNLNQLCAEALGLHEVSAWGREYEQEGKTGPAAQSLQPPVSANQFGEIQTVGWLVFPAWQPQSWEGNLIPG